MSQQKNGVRLNRDQLISQVMEQKRAGRRLLQISSELIDKQKELVYFFGDGSTVELIRVSVVPKGDNAGIAVFYPIAAWYEAEIAGRFRVHFQEEERREWDREPLVQDLGLLVRDRPAEDCLYAAERLGGTDHFGYSLGFCKGLEGLKKCSVPPRAESLRVVFAELERTASHLLWFSRKVEEPWQMIFQRRCLELRERILEFWKDRFGSRLISSICRVGGVRADLSAKGIRELEEILTSIELEWSQIIGHFLKNRTVLRMLESQSLIPPDDAKRFGMTGPDARACGLEFDCRDGDENYRKLSFHSCAERGETEASRCRVRSGEILESIGLARKALRNLPQGEIQSESKGNAEGEQTVTIELPEGEALFYMKGSGGASLDALTVRGPKRINEIAWTECGKDHWEVRG